MIAGALQTMTKKTTTRKRAGRPAVIDDRVVLGGVGVPRQWVEEMDAEAAKRGAPRSQIVREWLMRGRPKP